MVIKKMRRKNKGNRRGQITIFIIIALLLVSLIIGFFVLRGTGIIKSETSKKIEKNPQFFLDSCIEKKVKEGIILISSRGGYINHSLYKLFNDEKIHYLCYNQNYYYPCINQEPMLITHLEEELKNYIQKDVERCFNELKENLEKEKYNVKMGDLILNIEAKPKKIIVNMKRDVEIEKAGETSRYDEFNTIISTKFYDIAVVVQEIISQEARFCNFEQLGFMIFYPEFNIDKFRTGDSTTIYTIEHRKTKEEFRFAVRSCVIPPGIR